MSTFPSITAKQFIKVLYKLGFQKDRQKGSHLILINIQTNQIVTVPIHKGRDMGKGIVFGILKDIKTNKDEFLNLL
ncbi:type II toxin-antitoxin system HicA family toxin [Patescibacteria group bacterium]|nr:type II toxin-antitoxin system HicA family toxin [Patescibacteria group bacterium]